MISKDVQGWFQKLQEKENEIIMLRHKVRILEYELRKITEQIDYKEQEVGELWDKNEQLTLRLTDQADEQGETKGGNQATQTDGRAGSNHTSREN